MSGLGLVARPSAPVNQSLARLCPHRTNVPPHRFSTPLSGSSSISTKHREKLREISDLIIASITGGEDRVIREGVHIVVDRPN